MADRLTLINKSRILINPLLGGQAGLLRESGLIDVRSGMPSAWCRGLESRLLGRWKQEELPIKFTSFIYDETLHVAIIGCKYDISTCAEM